MTSATRSSLVSLGALAGLALAAGCSDAGSDGEDPGGKGGGDRYVVADAAKALALVSTYPVCGDGVISPLADGTRLDILPAGAEPRPVELELPAGTPAGDWTPIHSCVETADGPVVVSTAFDFSDESGSWAVATSLDGTRLWSRYDARSTARATGTGAGVQVVGEDGQATRFLDARTGEQVATLPEQEDFETAVLTRDGAVVVDAAGGWELRPAGGGKAIDLDVPVDRGSTEALDVRGLLLLVGSETVTGFDPATGAQLWSATVATDDRPGGDSAVAFLDEESGIVAVGLDGGRVVGIDTETGQVAWDVADVEIDGVADGTTYELRDAGHGRFLLEGKAPEGSEPRRPVVLLRADGTLAPTDGRVVVAIVDEGYAVPEGNGLDVVPAADLD